MCGYAIHLSMVYSNNLSSSNLTVLACFRVFFQKDILDAMPPTAAFVVALQADLQKSLDRHRQRRSCQDARSTLGWSTDEEEQWQVLLEGTRKGFVQWYSAIQDQ